MTETIPEADFEAAAQAARLRGESRNLAYACLVEGRPTAAVAEAYGVSRQWVHAVKRKVYTAYLKQLQVPKGWVVMTVRLPPDHAKGVRKLEEQLLKAAGRSG